MQRTKVTAKKEQIATELASGVKDIRIFDLEDKTASCSARAVVFRSLLKRLEPVVTRSTWGGPGPVTDH